MNFSTPDKVASVINNLKQAELKRSPNRALIDALFNGAPPFTQAEVEENRIQWNVNWNEGADLLLMAREQLENAFLSTDYAFTVQVPDAPKSKATDLGHKITREANKLLRRSLPYIHTQRSKWGSVALHGPGSQMWEDQWAWKPYFVPVGDLLVPTDTELPMENLNHFCARRRISPGRLFRKTLGLPEDKRDPGWNIEAVKKCLDQYADVNQNMNSWNWAEHAEKLAELWKQNGMYYETDAVPVIWLWDFYYQVDDCEMPCWHRKIMLDKDCVPGLGQNDANPIVYLYESECHYAKKLSNILHTQFLDGNNVPPFMYHSCRGLGMRLHDAIHALNRLRCQFAQKVFEDMMLLFRASDPIDRSRLDKIYLGTNYGIVPEGLNFVTRDQRYSPDARMVEMLLSNLKQLTGEGSQQFTQDIDTGTNKERTAFEVSALLNQTTRLTGSMLNLAYTQEAFAYEEICRRLTLPNTPDWEAKKFQSRLLEVGVPKKWIDASKWDIQPVRVLGSGNAQLEQAQAQAMLQIRPMLNPTAQNEVLHDYVYSVTHDPKRANRLAPLDAAPPVSDTVHDTELVFGALMSGSKVSPKPGLVATEVVVTMLGLVSGTMQQFQQAAQMGQPPQIYSILGLDKCLRYAGAYLTQMSQDKTIEEVTTKLGQQMSKLGNDLKALLKLVSQNAQGPDQMELARAQQQLQIDQAKAQQKLSAKERADRQKLSSKQRADAQKLAHKQVEFDSNMQRKQAEAANDVQIANATAVADVHTNAMTSAADAKIKADNATEE